MSVMEGQTTMGQAQGASVIQDELAFTDAEDRDLGEEQTAAATEGVTDPASKDKSNTADPGKNSNSSKARKRTKTGCLTCRKRRIKCGEERPTCSNCVKSKRNCEGYTPRVIFKHPQVSFHSTERIPQAHISQFPTLPSQDENVGQYGRHSVSSGSQVPLPFIAPRPSGQEDQAAMQVRSTMMNQGLTHGPYGFSSFTPDGQSCLSSDLPPRMPQNFVRQGSSFDGHFVNPKTERSAGNFTCSPSHPQFQHHQSTGESDSGIDLNYVGFQSDWSQASPSSTIVPSNFIDGQTNGISPTGDDMTAQSWTDPTIQALFAAQADQGHHDNWNSTTPNKPQDEYLAYLPQARHRYQQPNDALLNCGPPRATIKTDSQYVGFKGNGLSPANVLRYPNFYPQNPTAGRTNNIGAKPAHPPYSHPEIDDPDDDYFDVESDADTAADGHIAGTPTHDLGLMLAISASQGDKTFRSLTNYLNEPNVLASYHPTYSASPLMDPQTARLFCHFVTASAPTLSSCERHPHNPSIMFSGAPVPLFQRSLWTYSLPMLALSHQGLLHAMLAIASLHIAKLQHTSPTPSLKHYHYALRRVSKAISQPSKRNHVATLAATLLLGWYEVTTAEHNKWNSHLAGARQLIMDIDFAGMSKRVKAHKAQIAADHRNSFYDGFGYGYQHTYMSTNNLSDPSLNNEKSLDENLISTIMGWDTRYNDYGQVTENEEPIRAYNKPLTQKEIETFEMQCDLFWWYAKQDMYQSIVSGNRLLFSYDRWSHCPPRAPIGKLDAVYGTMDHLLLLVGRIADFAGKDQPRKRKVAELKERQQKAQQTATMGTQTTRPPNLSMPPPQIPMYGMMPDMGPVRLPAGFDDGRHASIPTAIPIKDQELDAATRAAEAEWAEICNALDTFEDALGSDYQPLSSDHMPPLSTPFGPALYYRTYPIHCVWTLFYTGRIITARCQPSMPPAAMIAAGVAAPRTAGWANTIGRICAGLQPVSAENTLNPRHGAALMDTCMALFHAGVQYRDAAQRGWTITKLRDVARLTGWQTSALIASGCERSWTKAAEMGRGPPYTKTMSTSAMDDRVSGRARDGELGPPRDNNDRRFITVNPGTRVYWALGILGMEEDMKVLDLKG